MKNDTEFYLPEKKFYINPEKLKFLRYLRQNKKAFVGILMIAFLVVVAVFADLIAQYPYDEMHHYAAYIAPNSEWWFGTDEYGRDIFSRIVYGTRISLLSGIVVSSIAAIIGIPMGLVAGYFGRYIDIVIMRITDVIFTFLDNDPVTSYIWDFGMDASPATATGIGPHTVTYSGEGTKTISLIVDGPNGKDTLARHDYVYVTDEINVFLPDDEIRLIPGDTIEITAYGADEYIWTPSGNLSDNTGQTVLATTEIEEEIDLTIYGTQGGCNDQTTLKIISSIPPANDNICDAILITPVGFVGTFTNENGTVEPGEPSPDPIGCVTDSTWCANEPGAVSSIWFYFYGPSSGIASLRSEGLSIWDNQVAVYRADSCIDVDKESLVAANDDQTASIYPFLLQLDVTPGAKYFVQLDGSGNDQEGTCDLYFNDSPVGLDNKTILWDGLSVFPNPASDIFNIHLKGMQSDRLQIQVYNTNGQLIIDRSSGIKPEEFNTRIDLSAYTDDIYLLRLVDGSRVMHRKLIKK